MEMAPIINLGLYPKPVFTPTFDGSWSLNLTAGKRRSGFAVLFGTGNFVVNTAIKMDFFMVGGGGGTSHGTIYGGSGGGGGGGRVAIVKAFALAAGSYQLFIGGGGGVNGGTFANRTNGLNADMGGTGGNTWSSGIGTGLGGNGAGNGGQYANGSAGGAGGSGGGGGCGSCVYGTGMGWGGASGVNGGNGGAGDYQTSSPYNAYGGCAGGAGSGQNSTVFGEGIAQCGYGATDYFGPGGIGGRAWQYAAGSAPRADKWAGMGDIRAGVANTGGGGGGPEGEWDYSAGIFNGTAGGSGIMILRWADE